VQIAHDEGDYQRVKHYVKGVEHPSERGRHKRSALRRTDLSDEGERIAHGKVCGTTARRGVAFSKI